VLEAYIAPGTFSSDGSGAVEGQRLMQDSGDIFPVGCTSAPSAHYYLRQPRDWKGSLNVDSLDPTASATYAVHCAWTLVRATPGPAAEGRIAVERGL
jgi:Uncharacterized protein conserved in bacteria (DUF2252)